MDESTDTVKPDQGDGADSAVKYYKRDFWSEENLRFTKPHFRLEKAARIVNKIAGDADLDLLDVGCGPATLSKFLKPNIRYHGIDMAIHDPAPNLLEADLVKSPIGFGDKQFDIVIAQGFFEYMGTYQEKKFAEIQDVLSDDGTFILSYVNFGHRQRQIYWPYSNVQPLAEFRASLSRYFTVQRSFPTSYNWNHSEPNRQFMRIAQLPIMFGIPLISQILGVEYFFICSKSRLGRPGDLNRTYSSGNFTCNPAHNRPRLTKLSKALPVWGDRPPICECAGEATCLRTPRLPLATSHLPSSPSPTPPPSPSMPLSETTSG